MDVSTFFKSAVHSFAALIVCAVMCSIGCDRAAPEKLGKKTQSGEDTTGARSSETATGKDDNRSIGEKITDEQTLFGSDTPAANETPAGGNADSNETPAAPRQADTIDVSDRSFMTLKPVVSERASDLVAHLTQVDAALRDLIVAGSNNIVGADTFSSSGMRLGQMKLTTGEKLASLPDATAEERKLGTVSQLVALSHMSGLKDIESAKKLEKLASALLQSSDADLAHQGRVVLLGFRLQDLQNGAVTEPTQLLTDLNGLFQRPSDAGFPEMMVLQQAQQILSQMGFAEAAGKIDQLVVDKYMDSPDLQLSSTAWSIAIAKSQSFANYNAAMQQIYEGKETEPQMLIGAARGLFDELPTATTLAQFSKLSTDLEYRGLVNVASELTSYVKLKSAAFTKSPYYEGITSSTAAQERRLGIRGQTLELDGLVDFEGKPFDSSEFKGKVVLIDFWATWCGPCLAELPNIRKARDEFASQGFEVLSINMDEDLGEARKFVLSNSFPWKTYHSKDLNALGFKSTIAQRLGINAIPFLVLIGTDGKVVAVHVRGDRLAPTIRTMLASGLSN